MATSGSNNLTMTGTLAIQEVLELLGVLGEGETPTAAQTASVQRTLNYVLKAYQNKGLQLFARKQVYVNLVANRQYYTASEFVDDLHALKIGTAGATSIVVDPTDINGLAVLGDISASYNATYLDVDGTTVNVDLTAVSATTLTWSGSEALAEEGTYVYVYKPRTLIRPQGFLDASVVTADQNSVNVDIMGLTTWSALSNKATAGLTTSVFYETTPFEGKLHVWPVATTPMTYLSMTAYEVIEDIDAEANDIAISPSWFLAIVYGTAKASMSKYGVPIDLMQLIMGLSKEYLNDAVESEIEYGTSVFFQPAMR